MFRVSIGVLFLIGHALGRREQIQVHSTAKGWELPGSEFEEMIAKIYATFVKRAAIVREQTGKPYTPAESMMSLFTNVERNKAEYNVAPCNGNGKINEAGFQKMYERASAWEKFVPTAEFQKSFSEFFAQVSDANGCIDKFLTTNLLSVGHMSAHRIAVLKDVFESVTGDVGTPMKVGDLPCKAANMQKWFFYCMHGDCEKIDASPVDFNTFKLYYNGLGMFISSDDQFELMLVNAWRMMGDRSLGGSYSSINTVNLRMRCYEDDDFQQEGTLVTLTGCAATDPAINLQMAREQTGQPFKYGCKY